VSSELHVIAIKQFWLLISSSVTHNYVFFLSNSKIGE